MGPELKAGQGEGEIIGTQPGKEEESTRRAPHLREPPKERSVASRLFVGISDMTGGIGANQVIKTLKGGKSPQEI